MRALLIVDVQNDFIEGGSLAVVGGRKVAKGIAEIVGDYSTIVTSQDWHIDPADHWSDEPDFISTWPVHCAASTFGAKIERGLLGALMNATSATVKPFRKGAFDAAYSAFEARTVSGTYDLEGWLRTEGVTELDVVGIATDYCVRATVRDALAAGFKVRVLENLVAGVTKEGHEAALAEFAALGAEVTLAA